jgi:hypothetical protein
MRAEKSTARILVQGLLRSVWAYVTALSTILTVALLPRQWYWAVPLGIGVLILIGAFRAVNAIRRDCEAKAKSKEDEIANLKEENAELKVKPYDEAHRQSAEDKLRKSNVTERDLLRFLLQWGRVDNTALSERCTVRAIFCREATTNLVREGLIHRSEERNVVRAMTYWQVNPKFEAVLRELLFPRNEPEKLPQFSP